MKRPVVLIALGWAALVVEAALWPALPTGTFRPDVIVVGVLVLALVGLPVEGIVLTYLLGMMSDLFGGGPRGLEVVSLTFVFLAAHALVTQLDLESAPVLVGIGAATIVGEAVLRVALLEMLAPASDESRLLLRAAPGRCAATVILFILAFGPLRSLHARLGPRHGDRFSRAEVFYR